MEKKIWLVDIFKVEVIWIEDLLSVGFVQTCDTCL